MSISLMLDRIDRIDRMEKYHEYVRKVVATVDIVDFLNSLLTAKDSSQDPIVTGPSDTPVCPLQNLLLSPLLQSIF